MKRLMYLTALLLLTSSLTQAYEIIDTTDPGTRVYGIFECTEIKDSGDFVLTKNISGAQAIGACINITASNVNLDCKGFTVSGTPKKAGIHVEGNDNTITNCVLDSNKNGIGVAGDRNTVTSNTANNNNDNGFYAEGENNTFTSNTANNNKYDGFYARGYSSTFTSNTANNNKYDGFYAWGNSNTFTSNTANNNSNGFYAVGNSNTFTSNTANNNNNDGFYAWVNSYTNTFTSNTANNNKYNGFYAGGNSNTFTSNIIKDNRHTGVEVDQGTLVFEGNEISGNGGEVVGEGNIIIRGRTRMIFKNNKVSDGCGLWQAKAGASVTLGGNDFCDAGGTRTCADGFKISCVGGQVVDDGGNAFFADASNCAGLKSEVTCGQAGIRNVARAPGDGQQPNYNDAWLPVFALLGVLALGGFMWWHSKKNR